MPGRALDDDLPLTLRDACEMFFAGAVTPCTLRAEALRGNLRIFRIGRRDFTTMADLRAMREQCCVKVQVRDRSARISTNGRSSDGASAQAALRVKLCKRQ
jgi:hypothetical protein